MLDYVFINEIYIEETLVDLQSFEKSGSDKAEYTFNPYPKELDMILNWLTGHNLNFEFLRKSNPEDCSHYKITLAISKQDLPMAKVMTLSFKEKKFK